MKLAEIFQNGMILQRNSDVAIFGEDNSEDIIKIELYKNDSKVCEKETVTDKNGKWIIYLPIGEAGFGYKLIVKDESDKIEINGIAAGDIWLCGGQSNMEFFNKYDSQWEATKLLPKNNNIRMYNVPQRAFDGHNSHNNKTRSGYGYWFNDKEKGYENFSAPAYSFARIVEENINVPIGLIGCNWGGSSASTWVSEEVLSKEPLNKYLKEYDEAVAGITPEEIKIKSMVGWESEDNDDNYLKFEPLLYGRDSKWQADFVEKSKDNPVIPMGPYNFNRPSGLYHNMLEKIIPFSIKGVLWYQGESDSGDRAFMYDQLLEGLINNWRNDFKSELPFIIVQLAPFGEWIGIGNEGYSLVRKMQEKVSDNVPNVYMASIMDIGNKIDIHPKEKKEVGRRLALLALRHIYGKDILADSPRFDSMEYDGRIHIRLQNADGLSKYSEENTLCVKCDGISIEVKSLLIENNEIIIELKDELGDLNGKQLTVGLGNMDYAVINIKNAAGLPVRPFESSL